MDEAAATRICARTWRRDPGRRPWLADEVSEPTMNAFSAVASRMALASTVVSWGLAGCGAASAHEFWLEPTAYRAPSGTPIGVYVCNGSGYEGWSLPRDSRRIEQFVALDADGDDPPSQRRQAEPVVGRDGSAPAGFVRLATPGGYVLVYQGNRAMTVQTDEKFDEYLKEKGLDAVLARRASEGRRRGRVRESYSRYAKALVQVGGAASPYTLSDRPLGLPLELVMDTRRVSSLEKTIRKTGGLQTFHLLYRGEPLAGALVMATRPGTTDAGMTARTDSEGRVQFKLGKRGVWRVSAVHMVAPPAGVDADWDSLWTSLTFTLPPSSFASTPSPAADSVASATAASTIRVTRQQHCRNQLPPGALQAAR